MSFPVELLPCQSAPMQGMSLPQAQATSKTPDSFRPK